MSLTLISKPSVYPVSLEEAKQNSVIEHSDDDVYILRLIADATDYVERYTGLDLIQRTWDYKFDSFPYGDIVLPKFPVLSVTSVTYTDVTASPNEQTLATSVYGLDSGNADAILYLKYNQSWPSHTVTHNGITVRFVSGYEGLGSPVDLTGNIPEGIKGRILMMVSEMYERREVKNELPVSSNAVFDSGLNLYRRWKI